MDSLNQDNQDNSFTSNEPPKAPHEVATPPVTEQVIDVDGTEVGSGDVNIVNEDIEAHSVQDLMRGGSVGFFEYIMEFEEEHPWIFFIGIALVLFVSVIYLLLLKELRI